MSEAPRKQPTKSEMAILMVLWDRGPSTVRQVYEELSRAKEMGYTTVLKHMQIMTEKGLLLRDEGKRPQVFRCAQSEKQTKRLVVGDLLERVFSGSTSSLVLHALSLEKADSQEIDKIRTLLDQLEEKRR